MSRLASRIAASVWLFDLSVMACARDGTDTLYRSAWRRSGRDVASVSRPRCDAVESLVVFSVLRSVSVPARLFSEVSDFFAVIGFVAALRSSAVRSPGVVDFISGVVGSALSDEVCVAFSVSWSRVGAFIFSVLSVVSAEPVAGTLASSVVGVST